MNNNSNKNQTSNLFSSDLQDTQNKANFTNQTNDLTNKANNKKSNKKTDKKTNKSDMSDCR